MVEPLDLADLERLVALESKAMRGPWFADGGKPHSEDGWLVFGGDGDGLVTCHGNWAYSATEGVGSPDQDAQFIVALRNACPDLLRLARAELAAEQEIARLGRALKDIARVHQAYQESEDSPSALAYLEFAGEVGTILRATADAVKGAGDGK